MAGTTGELTILIAARNAAATIERAVRSCLSETPCGIILADDRSTDDTVSRARVVGGRRLHVVPTPDPGGVAAARQQALDAVDTPFAAWLDADDLLLRALRRGATLGIVIDAGYRMYAFRSSLSRNLRRQRAALARALRKHDYEDVRKADASFARAQRRFPQLS